MTCHIDEKVSLLFTYYLWFNKEGILRGTPNPRLDCTGGGVSETTIDGKRDTKGKKDVNFLWSTKYRNIQRLKTS